MKWFLVVLLLIIFDNSSYGQQHPLKFSYLTVDEGLSHTDVKDIKQDKKGFIWIATLFGLDRYDGYSIKKFYDNSDPYNNALKNRIRNICFSTDDRIWLAADGGVQCFNARTQNFINISVKANDLLNDSCTKIILFKKNILFALLHNKLKCFAIRGNDLNEVSLSIPQNLEFTNMALNPNGELWLTSNAGVGIIGMTYQFHFLHGDASLGMENFSTIYFDHKNNVIIAAGEQLFRYNLYKLSKDKLYFPSYEHFRTIKDADITDIVEDNSENYWVSTNKGLYYLNTSFQEKQFITNTSFNNSINTNYLDKVYIDRSGCLWISTYGGGVNFCDLNQKLFFTLKHNPELSNSISGDHITAIAEDNQHNIWIGTNENGLNKYDIKKKVFLQYNIVTQPSLKSNEITSLCFDKKDNLWVGTDKGIDILNLKNNVLVHPSGYEKFPTHLISAMALDCFGNVWFGGANDGFGCIFNDINGRYHVKVHYQGIGVCVIGDRKKPNVMVSSTKGLLRLYIDEYGNIINSKLIEVDKNQPHISLSSNFTYPIRKQDDDTFWVGTIGGGLDRIEFGPKNSYNIASFGERYGIFNDVESIEIDNKNRLWLGGNGLECFDPSTKTTIRFDRHDGLQGSSFKVGASLKAINGCLYFGGINGLNYFYPDSIKLNEIPAKPILTDLVINGRVRNQNLIDSSTASLENSISYKSLIKLNYLQNNFQLSFSSMQYANVLKCQYRYKLEGFDKTWNYTGGDNPTANYSNLDYQHYKFIVEATNNDGFWSSQNANVDILITPPWWKSTVADILYTILSLSVFLGIYVYQAKWYRLKREMAVKLVEQQKRDEMHFHKEELYQQQLQFFTNISHEFRTPLTLILGPLEVLLNENKFSMLNHSFSLIHRNALRLVNMVNELMNFRKISDNVVLLHVAPIELQPFVKILCEEFEELCVHKKISFNLKFPFCQMPAWLDKQIVEKILSNLLSNAVKYTEAGGFISVEVFYDFYSFIPSYPNELKLLNDRQEDDYVYFRVLDTGIGISNESITYIFERYYRVNNNHLGSGVGLALVKSLTLLHKGNIFVYSQRHKGTEIIIALPSKEAAYDVSEKVLYDNSSREAKMERVDNSILIYKNIFSFQPSSNQVSSNLKKTLLLVEDNDELRLFIKNYLIKDYNVVEASDGNSGLMMAKEFFPDVIISDIMMPQMDGIELCQTIKSSFETSHIPFIILSAKDAITAKLNGMESGADFYFAKPLSIEFLSLTIRNLLEQRERLKKKYAKDYYADAKELVHSSKDKEFLDKLMKLIDDNITMLDLDVDFISKNMFISRTKLYNKIQSISGKSVGEFVRNLRLKKAAYIMAHEDITQNELVDRIGLQSNSYFSRAFKKEFGVSPSQYLQTIKVKTITPDI